MNLLTISGFGLALSGTFCLAMSFRRLPGLWTRRTTLVVLPVVLASFVTIVFGFGGHNTIIGGLAVSSIVAIAPGVASPKRPPPDRASLVPHAFAAALVLWLAMRELSMTPARPGALLGYVAAAAFIGVCGVVVLRGGISRNDLLTILVLYLSAGMVWAFGSGAAWAPCQPGKCTELGRLYKAGFPTENAAALIAGFVIILALGSTPGWYRRLALATGSLVLYASGGRTGIFGLLGAGLVAWILALSSSATRTANGVPIRKIRSAAAYVGSIATGYAAILVAAHSSNTDFSNRGRIWRAALSLVPSASILGRRVSDWGLLRGQDLLPDHSAHSIYVHVFFGGGLVALLLLGLFIGSLYDRVRGRAVLDVWYAALPVAFFMLAGLTEVVWNPATLDSLAIILLPLLASGYDSRLIMRDAEHTVSRR